MIFLCYFFILSLVTCSNNYLNLTTNFQLLQSTDHNLIQKNIQIDKIQNFMVIFQKYFRGKVDDQVTDAYSKYISLLIKHGDQSLLPMDSVEQLLDFSSFISDPNLIEGVVNKISLFHFLLYPKYGIFNTRGLSHFILKSHLYLRQLRYITMSTQKIDPRIFDTIVFFHSYLKKYTKQNESIALGISQSSINNHIYPYIENREVVKEENKTPSNIANRTPKKIKRKHHGISKSVRNGACIGLFLIFAIILLFQLSGLERFNFRPADRQVVALWHNWNKRI
jgi:hypothetical protein